MADTLFLSDSVTLDGSGEGTIRFPQVPPYQRWQISRISLTITNGIVTNSGGEARIFRSTAIAPNFIDGTNAPWNDVYGAALELNPAENLIVVFTGAGPGEVATVTVQGVRVSDR